MAKIRIRNFSLEMKDGNKVEKDIAELREHFDWERVLVYFHDGRLQRWLKINGYREEADKVADLQEGETFVANLCGILGVDVPKEETADADPEDIKNKSARLRRLRQYTTDEKILALVENVAFTQEEMEELIDEAAEEVVLCDAQFKIPLRERGIKYYGAGRAVAVIESETVVDFAARHIEFHKIVFDKKYQQIVDAAQRQELQEKAEEEQRLNATARRMTGPCGSAGKGGRGESISIAEITARSILSIMGIIQAKKRHTEADEWYNHITVRTKKDTDEY